ncbi:uncharacterized protein LOC102702889 [Oryza brachyantha]|uniref:Uncharacterized protein n=1 Tax=Oryza brachyantha TaxID=4533 RepID=J3L056_ORYBR|nr:uncharacterized protein LOC102702889 [Oryza brachyantha]
MATEVLRPHNVLLPSPAQRIRATSSQQRRPTARAPVPAAARRHQGKPRRAPAAAAVEVYAGPAFSVSPEPSALPLPQFPFRKAAAAVAVVDDDAATRDLRRMLRLE